MTSSGFDRAPAIETERLVLREQSAGDLDAAWALWSDPGVYRFIGGKPRPREDVWRRILANAGTWSLLGFGSWAVQRRSDGAYLGAVGLLDAQREIDPPFRPECIEAGWALSPAVHGKGLAGEAMRAVTAWCDAVLSDRPLVCMIAPENNSSIRLAEALGFREYARTAYGGEPTVLFERVKRDV